MIVAERDTAIAQLQAEVGHMKSTMGDDGAGRRAKAEQVERDLVVLQKADGHVLERENQNCQEATLLLAHALVKKKTYFYGTP